MTVTASHVTHCEVARCLQLFSFDEVEQQRNFRICVHISLALATTLLMYRWLVYHVLNVFPRTSCASPKVCGPTDNPDSGPLIQEQLLEVVEDTIL